MGVWTAGEDMKLVRGWMRRMVIATTLVTLAVVSGACSLGGGGEREPRRPRAASLSARPTALSRLVPVPDASSRPVAGRSGERAFPSCAPRACPGPTAITFRSGHWRWAPRSSQTRRSSTSATPPTMGEVIPASTSTSSSGGRPRACPRLRARRGSATGEGCLPRRRASPTTSAPTSPTMFGSCGASTESATSPPCTSSQTANLNGLASGPRRRCWTASCEPFRPARELTPSRPGGTRADRIRVHAGPSELVLDSSGLYVTSRGTDHAPGSRVTRIEAGSLATSLLRLVPEHGVFIAAAEGALWAAGSSDDPKSGSFTPLGWSGSIPQVGG
jgi:hypothetical protein